MKILPTSRLGWIGLGMIGLSGIVDPHTLTLSNVLATMLTIGGSMVFGVSIVLEKLDGK